MARSAFVLGGTGLVGRALVPLLVEKGFEVTVASRTDASVAGRHVQVDRSSDEDFDRATSGDHDLFVDVVAYTEHHARQLCRLRGRVGSIVVVSSAAVYADAEGHTLLGSEISGGGLISESDPVVASVPEGTDYAGGKVAVEKTLSGADLPLTIIRPGAIFGPGDRASREWYFVKRIVDHRRTVILAYGGASRFHHVSSTNVATMIAAAAEKNATGIFNCGDPSPADVMSIGEAVGRALDHDFDFTVFAGPPRGPVGDTPWTVPHPFQMDLRKARERLGFRPAVFYEEALKETCEWLVRATADRPWQAALPGASKHYGNLFDYDAEDAFLAGGTAQ